jgi:hypothetical protein
MNGFSYKTQAQPIAPSRRQLEDQAWAAYRACLECFNDVGTLKKSVSRDRFDRSLRDAIGRMDDLKFRFPDGRDRYERWISQANQLRNLAGPP